MSRPALAVFDLAARCKLHLTGADRVRFVNGQITNDVRKAGAQDTIEACVLTAKGKIDAHLYLSAADDFLTLDCDAVLREGLPSRLDRYIIADDVQIGDVTEEFALFHVTAETLPPLPNEWRRLRANRFGVAGLDIWIEHAAHAVVRQELATAHSIYDEAAMETYRIEQGIPRWGKELTNEIIPNEAGLEARAIDYVKGCYIGQEVISRMKTSGQLNKRLSGLVSLDGRPLAAGMRLRATADGSRDAGWITSAAQSERVGRQIALAYVKRPFYADGSALEAAASDGAAVAVEIVALPFI